jgi:hypothetical protein
MRLSNKEKQAEFRRRQAEQGLQEVRGVFLPADLHADLKAHAAKLLAKHQRVTARKNPAKSPQNPTSTEGG